MNTLEPSTPSCDVPGIRFDRRDFLSLAGRGLGFAAVAACLPSCSSGDKSPPPSATLPPASAAYTALKRTSFGVHRDTLSAINTMGVSAYLAQQLDYQSIDDGNLEATIAATFPLTQQSPDQLIVNFPDNFGDVAGQMTRAAQYRQIFSRRQLYEVMVEFWTDHFNIHLLNGLGPVLKPQDDREVIRAHALGNFRDLLHASAKSPAMLFYLDNFLNLAGAANENYARELMELHTLGVNGGYTENDVKEVARCFTGWTIRFPGDPSGTVGTFKFEPLIHDDGTKQVLGNPIGPAGQSEGEQILDLLAVHPSTANFIATKLCRRFITDNPESPTVDAVAAAFVASSGDITQTLQALFATAAFTNTADLKFTRPSEYLAGTIRALAPDTAYPSDDGLLFVSAQNILGQLPYYWSTPDGYPDVQSYWANTGGLLNRWRMSFLSLADQVPEINVFTVGYTSMLAGANTPDSILDRLIDQILMRPVDAGDRQLLLDWLTGTYSLEPDTVLAANVAEAIAAVTAAVLISSAYFQLR